MKVTVHVDIIARNVRPIRSENFEQRIRQCARCHREVVLVKRDCSNSTTSVLVGEQVRLDTEINGLAEQDSFCLGITTLVSLAEPSLKGGDHRPPSGIRAVCAVQGGGTDLPQLCGVNRRTVDQGSGCFSFQRSNNTATAREMATAMPAPMNTTPNSTGISSLPSPPHHC